MKIVRLILAPCQVLILSAVANCFAAEIFVSLSGSDQAPGSLERPVATLHAAQRLARAAIGKNPDEPVTITIGEGVHYLADTLLFTAEDSGSTHALVTYRGQPGKQVVLSGGARLDLAWQPWRDGILKAKSPPGFETDQLFVNGERMILARYPNFNANERIFNGWAADAFSKERAAHWINPAGGFIHAMHRSMWGGYSYRITGKDAAGEVTYEGGWQNNRQMGMHAEYRYVENILEELDAPGEWFFDRKAGEIYFHPPESLDFNNALFEAPRLKRVIEFRGTMQNPVRRVRIAGLTIRHALRTFMDTREPLLRSDWTIAREGALLFEGTEDCTLEDSVIDQVGGNAVFFSNFNRRAAVRRCDIDRAGGSGIAFVGDQAAVRNPLFEYRQRQASDDLDLTRAPKPRITRATAPSKIVSFEKPAASKSNPPAFRSPWRAASASPTAPSTASRAPASTSATAAGAATSSRAATSSTPSSKPATMARSIPGDAIASGA